MYITVNSDKNGKMAEVFATLGKSGTCVRHWTELVGRIISLLIKSDTDIKRLSKTLKGIQCQNSSDVKKSCADAFALALDSFLEIKKEDIAHAGDRSEDKQENRSNDS